MTILRSLRGGGGTATAVGGLLCWGWFSNAPPPISGVVSSLSIILSPPKDQPLRRLPCFLRRQKPKRIRPNATAAPPTLATVTPAICGLVRTGFVAAAAAATAEDDVAAATELVDELVEDVVVVV